MNKKALIKTAQKYLELEENPIFCREVEDLMNSDNIEELTDRFWRELDFGTGGLRGVIGGGNNRMNPYVVRKATRGLAQYISKNVAQGAHSVVIAYDSRHYSDLFAEEAARVLAAVDITAWLFPSLRPTPVLSYAVRKLNAAAGIMITASHNPAKYNGYKVFWSDGAQVVPPHDKGIIAEVRKVSGKIAVLSRADAEEKGLIRTVPKDLDTAYSTMVVEQCMKPQMVREHAGELSIVYSPLHGAGTVPVEQVMQNLGIHIITVPEQREPDGAFPTVEFPNPEIAPTLKMALELAKEKNADLVMATDPDADRLGIAIPDGDQWLLVSGNRLGALLTDYIFRTKKDMGLLPAQSAFINTIVTSEFQNRIADYYGATSFRVLTGFKYIGEKIRQFEEDHTYTYIFGGEESYGYLVGTSVRDKDAVSAASMTAEMALWNRSRGKSVMDHLHELWTQFGYYDEMLISRDFEGQKGQNTMDGLMESLRAQSPRKVGSIDVVRMRDFFMGTTQDVHTGKTEKDIDLPASNVIQYVLEDGSLFTVRPSGTEPKIKFYVSCRSNQGENLSAARLELSKKFADIEMWVHKLVSSQ